jgi:hypothetical protein
VITWHDVASVRLSSNFLTLQGFSSHYSCLLRGLLERSKYLIMVDSWVCPLPPSRVLGFHSTVLSLAIFWMRGLPLLHCSSINEGELTVQLLAKGKTYLSFAWPWTWTPNPRWCQQNCTNRVFCPLPLLLFLKMYVLCKITVDLLCHEEMGQFD